MRLGVWNSSDSELEDEWVSGVVMVDCGGMKFMYFLILKGFTGWLSSVSCCSLSLAMHGVVQNLVKP